MSILSGTTANPGPAPAAPPAASGGPARGRSHLIAGARVVGELTAPGTLEIQGRVEGRVGADAIVIEERGTVEGEAQGGAVEIRGGFDGTLTGGAVRIQSGARVSGTILYESLSIESGAEVTATFTRARAVPAPQG
ncbi:polymer-forming cytoskeletal protein [Rubellimicrobium sp. CFH 75288]|uniref:bactofilin family protein n=1 Tax=Rubellimicrobium sp. CFH 75288 TaxID=2697034 RepID=UPI001411E7DD|nr:polymer-forming cytoskeletal protein [Rubellimicrobium sp. CFH 75288]